MMIDKITLPKRLREAVDRLAETQQRDMDTRRERSHPHSLGLTNWACRMRTGGRYLLKDVPNETDMRRCIPAAGSAYAGSVTVCKGVTDSFNIIRAIALAFGYDNQRTDWCKPAQWVAAKALLKNKRVRCPSLDSAQIVVRAAKELDSTFEPERCQITRVPHGPGWEEFVIGPVR